MAGVATRPLRVLVVGLDGGTWTILEPLIRAGALPNIAHIAAGTRGTLDSTIPPVTPPAWTACMTGKNPGRHGLFHFVEPEPGSYRMRYTNARSRKAPTIWSMLSETGNRVGVVNVPMTFPPEPVDGFMISGMDAPAETSNLVYPRRLGEEIERAVGPVRLDAQHLGFMHNDRRRQEVLDLLRDTDEHRLRMVQHLLDVEPVEVLMVVYGSTDAVQHHFWHYADPSHFRHDPVGGRVFGTAIADTYRRLDRHIGALAERLRDDGVVILVSDHGFGPTSSRILYLNRYLSQLGVLSYRQTPRRGVAGIVSPVARPLDGLLRGALSSGQKRWLARRFPTLRVRWESSLAGFDAIDWERTKAYSYEAISSSATIWINVRGRQPMGIVDPGGEYRELVRFLSDRLRAVQDPRTGRPLVQSVIRRDEAYAGPYLAAAPDLCLAWWEGEGFETKVSVPAEQDGAVIADARLLPPGRAEWSGAHRLEGIFAARGRGIRNGAGITDARIMDIAPTILHLMHRPIPEDMDGRVLTEIFDAEHAERHPVGRRAPSPQTRDDEGSPYSAEEGDMITRRLQDLGYLE